MRILEINAVPYGSTGRIMFALADRLEAQGHQVLCTTGFTWIKSNRSDYFMTSNILEKSLHTYLARFTGRIGCFSRGATKRLLRRLDAFRPDVIHIHNLHGWYVNLPMLFDYIKRNNIPVVWTFHDCWAYTGHCPLYSMVGCEKWTEGCHDCPQYKKYPQTFMDHSRTMWQKKRDWFTGVPRLTIATPSHWLAGEVHRSFLKEYPIQVIPNGIDLSVFRPMESDFRKKHRLEDKYVLLGVAYEWGSRKGLDVFLEIAKRLDDRFRIVLVGTDDKVDQQLPENILSIHRTQNQQELAQLYSAADLFVNPTREDNYPTVNMESLACGTPVLTFRTGGSPEIPDDTCGCTVPCSDVDQMEAQILRICQERPYSKEACLRRAQLFDKDSRMVDYEELMKTIVSQV